MAKKTRRETTVGSNISHPHHAARTRERACDRHQVQQSACRATQAAWPHPTGRRRHLRRRAAQIRRYEAGTSQAALDVLRNLALALNTSVDLPYPTEERGTETPSLRLRLEARDQLGPDKPTNVLAVVEGALPRRQVRRLDIS